MRQAVFTCHQIGSNLSTYQTFRFHRTYIDISLRRDRKEIPVERQAYRQANKVSPQGSIANYRVTENSRGVLPRKKKNEYLILPHFAFGLLITSFDDVS